MLVLLMLGLLLWQMSQELRQQKASNTSEPRPSSIVSTTACP
ncbi:hypothetical protein P4238_08990 [Pseudomonas aeruginosa]|nr:hypothetical protein [Pseudomonas aeruginosa]